MPNSSLSAVIQQLRAVAERVGTGRTDGELLTQFLSRRDVDALAVLVERHAPMVWGVCCRILHNPHDAEDAFQATFLVLVQKAATVAPREMVANWLHGVAQQTAVRLKAMAAKRGWREVQLDVMPEPAEADARDVELLSRLDEELSRLPERCRALIVLCDLEGRTRKEVAQSLSCPEGTVASGLARARELLAKRLTRRGLVVSGGSLAVTLSHSMASADVPTAVLTSTINVATLLTAGKAAGVISGPVATLTQGVLKTMFLKKILTTTMAVLALGVAVITGGSLAVGKTDGKPTVGKELKATVAEKPMAPAAKQEKANQEPEVAWGKEVDGLQLGLTRVPADKTALRAGETMEFTVKVRNVSKEKLTLSYGLPESTPTITDAQGEEVQAVMPPLLGFIVIPTEQVLQPGDTVELYHRKIAVEGVQTGGAEQTGHVGTPTIRVGAGKYKIAFPEFVTQNIVRSTGEVEFEVKDGDEKKQPEPKEAFTAWGQEVGGVQAGLGLLPGAKRVYQLGDTVTLVVRVRNVSKQVVKFEYVRQFLDENPPTVTNADGKAVPQSRTRMEGFHGPTAVSLEPGQEIVLETRMHGAAGSPHALLPEVGGVSSTKLSPLFVGTGKISLQYERVIANSSSGKIKIDSALEKLATGKLELEVKELGKAQQPKKETSAVSKDKAKADYWPRRLGDKWVYDQDGQEVAEEVAKVVEKDGQTRVTTTYSAGPGNSWEMEYLVKGGAVYLVKGGPHTLDPPVRLVGLELKAGAKWESKTPLTKGVLGNGGEMVAGEEQQVTVPAGTFKAVPVVYTVTEVDGKPIPKPTVYTYWYAAGVGLVKLKYDGGEKVLKTFTPASQANK